MKFERTCILPTYGYTLHGKGPCDGIGGEVKRQVWRATLQGKAVITDATSFAATADKLCPRINIMLCPAQDIEQGSVHLVARWELCKLLPQTQQVHYVCPVDAYHVVSGRNSIFSCPEKILPTHTLVKAMPPPRQPEIPPSSPEPEAEFTEPDQREVNIEEGVFVTAIYDSKWWVAKTLTTSETHATLKFMKSTGVNRFTWPSREDILPVPKCDILCIVQDPASRRNNVRYLELSEEDVKNTKEKFEQWKDINL